MGACMDCRIWTGFRTLPNASVRLSLIRNNNKIAEYVTQVGTLSSGHVEQTIKSGVL